MLQKIVGNIILPSKILYGGTVHVENGVITDIFSSGSDSDFFTNFPYIAPGLIDIHNHGAMGHDYMEASDMAFQRISEHLLRHGVTTAQCTTISAPINQLIAVFDFYRRWIQKPLIGCRYSGIHVEGPFISPQSRGAHKLDSLQTPENGYDWILEYKDVIRELTIAPELPGMPSMIRELVKAGIVVSGGHDHAEPEDIVAAAKSGMNHCTHIYCAMSTLHKTQMHRRYGLCEYAMSQPDFTAEMIADNHHVPPELAQMIYRCKGAQKCCVVSDAIAPTGLPASSKLYSLGTGADGTKVFVENGVAIVEDRTCYAGSIQTLDQMVRNLVIDAGIPLYDAVRMASLTPAEIIGIDDDCGSIEIGKRADMVELDSDLRVRRVMQNGQYCHVNEEH
ncbi:MAG: N-acetylglucosamine-6-phosphate deacetylase [Eubacteriales bacterium]|nr:N-acetylglucosamine-6-phosphate deacetylase [Eubacteriales bacterium]